MCFQGRRYRPQCVRDGWFTGVPHAELRQGWRIRLIAKSGPPKFKPGLEKVGPVGLCKAGLCPASINVPLDWLPSTP